MRREEREGRPDAELARRAAEGDEAAFDRIAIDRAVKALQA